MIKFANQVPSVYPAASRDFQYLCWLIDIVLNNVKHNVDDIYNLPNSKTDSKLTELLAITLGFKVKRNYDQNQLRALVAALPRILKYKGTKTAIDMAGNALIAASGASGDFSSEISEDDAGELVVTFPVNLVDISLFTDLLEYILPAGMTCHIVRKNQKYKPNTTELDLDTSTLFAKVIPDVDNFTDDGEFVLGLANIFEAGASELSFTNFINNNEDSPNIGLLSNSIIPILSETMEYPTTTLPSHKAASSNTDAVNSISTDNEEDVTVVTDIE